MTVGVIFGSILWLFARELGKPRQEEHDAKLQNLEKEIELLKLRLTALEQETVHDKAEVGQARKLRAVLSEHADDIQTTPAPLHEKVEPVATADNASVESHIEPVATPSFSTPVSPVSPVSAEPSVQPEPALYADSVETPAQVSAIQEDERKQDAPVLQTSSENADADSRETVIHKEEGFDFKFSENPIVAWFLRGNPLLKTGIVVLFLGLAFLLRYASERIYVPVEMRYLTVAGAGLAAVIGGWKLQSRKREYGLVLQGFGVAVMYLTSLAALKLHPLLPRRSCLC